MVDAVNRAHVIGMGRAGRTLAARLSQRGLTVTSGRDPDPSSELILLCVPDGAIAAVAAAIPVGPWVAHVSGATPLTALEPHRRRFSLHPLVAFDLTRGPEQLDGAWAAIAAETAEARAIATRCANLLGLTPFDIAEDDRPLYHAAASIASNYLVALQRSAARLFALAGAPTEALVPLMRGTLQSGFPLTGPIARGDWETVAAHVAALRASAADLVPMYQVLAKVTARLAEQPLPPSIAAERPG